MLLDGKGVLEVAGLLKVAPSSVSRWKQAVEAEGLDGLAAKPHPGPAPRLSAEQKGQLQDVLLAGAVAFGFASDGWTCPRVAQVIAERFGVEYHVDHVWKLLRGLGFTCQRPEHRARERDEQAVATWRRRAWPRIKKRRAGGRR